MKPTISLIFLSGLGVSTAASQHARGHGFHLHTTGPFVVANLPIFILDAFKMFVFGHCVYLNLSVLRSILVPELEESELPSAEDVSLPVASSAVTLFHFPDPPFLEWFLVLLGVEPRAVSC